MSFVGKLISYNEKKKISDVQLMVDTKEPMILKDVMDARATVGGGVEIEQPMAIGDYVLLTEACMQAEYDTKKIDYEVLNDRNMLIITKVLKTKKSPSSMLTYTDSRNKILLDGKGQATIKIGDFELFEVLLGMQKTIDDLLKAINGLTATVVTQGGVAVGIDAVSSIQAKLVPIIAENKKIKITIEGAKKQ